jgi:hypothetical protein
LIAHVGHQALPVVKAKPLSHDALLSQAAADSHSERRRVPWYRHASLF